MLHFLLPNEHASVVKASENCFVVETANYFYKVRRISSSDPRVVFNDVVMQAFASEYAQLGISWTYSSAKFEGLDYRVQKRQKLQPCSTDPSQLKDVIVQAEKIKRRVESRLEFPRVMHKLKSYSGFEAVNKVVLARDRKQNVDDFAIFNGHTIILGDSCWFLALLNGSGKWVKSVNNNFINLNLSYGTFNFAMYEIFEADYLIERVYESSPKWWMFESQSDADCNTFSHLQDEYEAMLTSNLSVLSKKVQVPVKTTKDYSNLNQNMVIFRGLD